MVSRLPTHNELVYLFGGGDFVFRVVVGSREGLAQHRCRDLSPAHAPPPQCFMRVTHRRAACVTAGTGVGGRRLTRCGSFRFPSLPPNVLFPGQGPIWTARGVVSAPFGSSWL